MVMTVTEQQILAETDFPQQGLICETHSRNRQVEMFVEDLGRGIEMITLYNRRQRVGVFTIAELSQAVLQFNYYGSRNLD